MKNVAANARFWIAGITIALIGVALSRWVGPTLLGRARIVGTVSGQLLALFGLFIICLGVRQRIKQTADQ